jgi:uncharacterized protein (DUF2062 family)
MGGWRERVRAGWDAVRSAFTGALSPRDVFVAIFLGVFIGCLPTYGLHVVLSLALARVWGLNPVLMTVACNISNPLFMPLLIGAEIYVGELVLDGVARPVHVPSTGEELMAMVRDGGHLLWACTVGSVFVGLALGAVLGGLGAAVAWARR